jgi:hypothetical protein
MGILRPPASLLAASLAIAGLQLVLLPSPALAFSSCPGANHYDFVSSAWYPSGGLAAGVEAPVQLRETGTVCSGGPTDSADSDWIAIEPSSGAQIVQMGFVHLYNSAISDEQYCRFWANGGGGVHAYHCGNDVGGTFVYYKIIEFFDVGTHTYLYDLEDCGPDGYTSCTTRNSSQTAWTSSFGVVSAESNYGGSTCMTRIMGNDTHPANLGTDVNPIEWQASVGGSFATRSLSSTNANCADYQGAFTDSVVSTWDSRN